MWAGVAGGMAEYFDLDPSLVRLLWVAATFVSGGLAVAVYILLWIILPRDDRVAGGPADRWRPWSHEWYQEFHHETQRLAEEARRMAEDVRDASHGWRAPSPNEVPPAPGPATPGPASSKTAADPATTPAEDAWWRSEPYRPEPYLEPHRGRHARSTGIVLVALGALLLAANAGVFSWINWHLMWPLFFIGLGVILLGRQSGWWSR